MKKFLLASTALAGLVSFAAAANAESPTVTIGGYSNVQVGVADQKATFQGNGKDTNVRNTNEVDIKVSGKADSGLAYGAVIALAADATPSDSTNNTLANDVNSTYSYIFVEDAFGRVELGGNVSAVDTLQVDASNLASATGGINGDWYYFVNTNFLAGSSGFITSSDLPVGQGYATTLGVDGGPNDGVNANKLTYYTPRFSGVQFGVSFTPDTNGYGNANGFAAENQVGAENVVSLGLNYAGQFDQVAVNAAATGEFGSATARNQEDLSAYNLGATLSYAGFSVGGSYANWGESLQVKTTPTTKLDDADFWTAGLGYEVGPFSASVTYLDATYQNNDTTNLVFGADYKLAQGLIPYVEVAKFDLDPSNTAAVTTKNDGTLFLVGTQVNF